MPSSSEISVLIPEQDKAAVANEYHRLQWQCVFELFGPAYDFECLLFLYRAMNDLERRDPSLKQQRFLWPVVGARSRVQ